MSSAWACSELQEAAALLASLLGSAAPSPRADVAGSPSRSVLTAVPLQAAAVAVRPGAATSSPPSFAFRSEQLEHALQVLCERGELRGAVLADDAGLAVAAWQSPVPAEIVAAYTSVVGGALDQAHRLLGRSEANRVAMDLDSVDKLVLRRFEVGGALFFLLVICPKDVDERAKVEQTVEQLGAILGR